MQQLPLQEQQYQPIHLAFDSHTLETLLREGKLHAADFKCLDLASKRSVWHILKSATAERLLHLKSA